MDSEVKEQLMQEALIEAKKAWDLGEVPVGAVITDASLNIISRGHNQIESLNFSVAHAEILAIKEASATLKNWRLNDCKLFVTLEPCVMCTGALVLSRISEIYFGCTDPRMGAAGSVFNLANNQKLPHQIQIQGGILETECSLILKDFFKEIRKKE